MLNQVQHDVIIRQTKQQKGYKVIMSINIKINGKDIELNQASTIAQMLEEREVSGKMFVVEQNLKIIQKEEYSTTEVKENDIIEIVGFFGGG